MLKMAKLLGIFNGKKAKTKELPKENSSSDEFTFKEGVKQIEGLPFCTVKQSPNNYFVVYGNSKITERVFVSHEEASAWANQLDWNTILNTVAIYVDYHWNKIRTERIKKLKSITK